MEDEGRDFPSNSIFLNGLFNSPFQILQFKAETFTISRPKVF